MKIFYRQLTQCLNDYTVAVYECKIIIINYIITNKYKITT